jgi:signal transduction histidine kinase
MKTILIVDDRPTNRRVLIAILAHCGHRLREAESGTQALKMMRKEKPDLVIADILMPKMDGYEFVRKLRLDPKIGKTAVVFYTASYIEEKARKLAKACGVRYTIVKPGEPEEVLSIVEEALSGGGSTLMQAPPEEFERNHLRLLTDKLSEKVTELEKLNAELEQRVSERTAELEAANEELEAFSYSVSHDLRAPLRAIDGFSRIAIEDFAGQMPEQCREQLQQTRESTREMTELIDDLLIFSQTSRSPLARENVETEKLARSAFDELLPQQQGRQVDFRIEDLPACAADPALLKQVFVNLVSNALKFTRGCARALVQVGCERRNGELVYFVKDNGAGFDMRHANKLFGVFQRLHRVEEFEGTGVGLAIVQRVIHRHGGRVWAKAKPNAGATFYFALPNVKL